MKLTQQGFEKGLTQENHVKWTHPTCLGYLYPEPDNKYTLASISAVGSQYQGLELAWAAPILAYHYNPTSLGWQNVE